MSLMATGSLGTVDPEDAERVVQIGPFAGGVKVIIYAMLWTRA
jgi:hypothetical protein